jgi:elongation factor Tu
MHELVEMEVREILSKYEYDGDNITFIFGSALAVINDENASLGKEQVQKLLDTMDKEIEVPERDINKPFSMAVETVYHIAGRGAVAAGTVEHGKAKVGDEI